MPLLPIVPRSFFRKVRISLPQCSHCAFLNLKVLLRQPCDEQEMLQAVKEKAVLIVIIFVNRLTVLNQLQV